MGAPNQLLRRGWNKNSLPVGPEVIVEGYRAKNGSDIATAAASCSRRPEAVRRLFGHRRALRRKRKK